MNNIGLDPDSIGPQLKAWFDPPANREVRAGVAADDCAAISVPATTLVLSSDFVNATPIGLELGVSDQRDLGYYLVASNISDLAGSGARPLGVLVNIMWSRQSSADEFWEVMAGVRIAGAMYDAPVLGGDTKLTSGRTVMNAVAIGTIDHPESLLLQSQARVGDRIWISGQLGSCAAAIVGLESGQCNAEWIAWANSAVRRPVVPLEKAHAVASLKLCAGGVDISDGLCADLGRMAAESAVGVRVMLDDVPVAPELVTVAEQLGVHPGSFALTIGGDLQFAVTARPDTDLAYLGMTQIGEVVEQDSSTLIVGRRSFSMPQLGHRDAHDMPFAQEVKYLMEELPFYDNH